MIKVIIAGANVLIYTTAYILSRVVLYFKNLHHLIFPSSPPLYTRLFKDRRELARSCDAFYFIYFVQQKYNRFYNKRKLFGTFSVSRIGRWRWVGFFSCNAILKTRRRRFYKGIQTCTRPDFNPQASHDWTPHIYRQTKGYDDKQDMANTSAG